MAAEIYVSTDIETDGFAPGENSMLSLGSAAYTADKRLVASFSVNLETLPGARANPITTRWWRDQPEAWAACRADPQPPQRAMREYATWLRALPGRPVFVGYPVVFDFGFVSYYLMQFAGENPFGFAALDIRSFAMAVMQCDFKDVQKKRMPQEWFDDLPHTHIALDDAIEQGALFCNLLKLSRAGAPGVPPDG